MYPRLDTEAEVAEALAHLGTRHSAIAASRPTTAPAPSGCGPTCSTPPTTTVIASSRSRAWAALENVEAIAAAGGVDVLFVGPRDLSHCARPCHGRFDAPEYSAALARVVAAARAAGVSAGVLASGRGLRKAPSRTASARRRRFGLELRGRRRAARRRAPYQLTT
jgi:2-dehydro-3-deoxyglucarate aldolase/4-hydroxy-2-oxoheptanedioate aldolase